MMLQRWNQNRTLTLTLLFLVTALGIYVGNHLLTGVRADVTAEGLYSLTDGTEQILKRMRDEGVAPVDVRLYFSRTAGKTLPSFIKDFLTYEEYIRNLLREYEKASAGKVRVAFIDPLPDTDEAQDALDLGLDGKLINQNGDLFFFGLVFETSSGSRRVLDFLWPEEQERIEYQISKEIYNLIWPSTQRVAVLSSLEVLGTGDNPYMAQLLAAQGKQPARKWAALELLAGQYELTALEDGVEEIPRESYDLLLVIHPKNLAEGTLKAIDRWVRGGGNALIFVDPYATEDQPPINPQDPQGRLAAMQYQPASDLEPLLTAWGVEWTRDAFVADLELAGKANLSARGPAETMLLDLRVDRQKDPAVLAEDAPVLQGINTLRLFMAGALRPVEPAPQGIQRTVLLASTEAGDTVTILPGFDGEALHYFDLQDPGRLRDAYSPQGTQVLAYQLQGRFPAVYPELVPAASEETEGAEGAEGAASGDGAEATVVVVADTDLLTDNIAFSPSVLGLLSAANDNATLFLNLVDYLLGSQELMRVRARKGIERPFTLFDQIEGAAEAASLEREKELRAEIETFQQQLQERQRSITQSNAALLEKRVRDEVEQLDERVREANRELLEIRKARRAALENEEANVRFSVLWIMPLLVFGAGVLAAARRRAAQTATTERRG
jgi:ABC-type uncharacterized transport system involved in gliding motility auxiliary subunit